MVNIGIIGAGRIADLHAPGYLEHPHARISAVADNYPGLAEERATEWNAESAYTDYREMLEDKSIDAVEILTPHSAHFQMITDALDAGKHVSVQKPMAISLQECDEIVQAASGSDKIFRVFENFKYYEPLAKAKKMLDEGMIGQPVSIRMKTIMGSGDYGWKVSDRTKRWRFDEEVSGGGRVTLDYGWHIFAMARHLMGEPKQVFASIRGTVNAEGFRVDCPLIISWTYKDGNQHGSWEAHASNEIVMQSDYYSEDEWFEITGSRGFIWVNQCTGKLLRDTPPLVYFSDGEMIRVGADEIDADWGASFRIGTKELVDCILNDATPGLNAEEGREIYRFVRAAQMSSRDNRPVKPEEVDL